MKKPKKETAKPVDDDVSLRVAKLRSAVRETFGSVAISMMALPRYRHLPIGDLQQLILEPLVRDRIALAKKVSEDGPLADIAGMAIWASVTDEVDAKIREQIAAGVFPVRLGADDWTGGTNNWLFDVIAPDPAAAASVIANFKALVKEGDLRLHPLVTRLVEKDTLEKLGAKAVTPSEKMNAS
ncbi:toxin-activating lysine-acyltransferase [Rhodobacteraceae bacterium KMM 6894]|nr:toxin-activating lysine-acyltransferase [Rhodobacteraceae bacterium KMM 6894]